MRSDGTRGFVFVNQYQRLRCMQRVEDVRFDTGTVCFPPLTVPGGASFILPFGLELCGETLTYATAQPICRDGNTIFFAALDGIEPCYCFGSTAYRPAALPDTHRFGDLCVVTLPFAQALYLRKLNGQVVLGIAVMSTLPITRYTPYSRAILHTPSGTERDLCSTAYKALPPPFCRRNRWTRCRFCRRIGRSCSLAHPAISPVTPYGHHTRRFCRDPRCLRHRANLCRWCVGCR